MNEVQKKEVMGAGSDAGVIAGLIAGTVRLPVVETLNGKTAVFVPRDGGGYDLKEYRDEEVLAAPQRVSGRKVVTGLESLLVEAARWPEEMKLAVANVWSDKQEIMLCLNPKRPGLPSWEDHWVVGNFQHTRELTDWLRKVDPATPMMSHEQLADFLEDARGIVEAERGDVLSTVAEFRMIGSEKGTSRYDKKSGMTVVSFEGGQNVETELPALRVRLQVWDREPEMIYLRVNIRVRKGSEGKMMFSLRAEDWRGEVQECWEGVVRRFMEDARVKGWGLGERTVWV